MEMKDIIKKLIRTKGITYAALGKELGLSYRTIQAYCLGTNTPTTENQLKIADYFGVTLDYLNGRKPNVVHHTEDSTVDEAELLAELRTVKAMNKLLMEKILAIESEIKKGGK